MVAISRHTILLALLACLAGCGDGPQGGAARGACADILEPVRARHHLSALAAVVVTREGGITVGAVGRRRRFDSTPVTADDCWHLGSNTKAFTATLIARLMESDSDADAWRTSWRLRNPSSRGT
jgi:D-alanyl-D-alanine carboxypeptidase